MRINVKLLAVVSVFGLIGIGALAGITFSITHQEISRMAESHAQSIARENGEKVSAWFEDAFSAARNLASIMEAYQEIPLTQRRNYFTMMLQQMLIANPKLLALYTNWAPDALDSMDAQYASIVGTDDSGRFMPAWDNGTGELRMSPFAGFSWDTVLTQMPVFNAEYMLDPAVYPFPEGNVLYATIGSPVRDKETGNVVGLTGAVLALSTIQEMVDQLKPFGNNDAMLFSAGGFVIAHNDARRLGKDMMETESDTFGSFLNTMVDAVTQGKPASFAYQSPQSNTLMQYYAVPITIGQVPQPLTLVVKVSRAAVMPPAYRMIMICFAIGIAAAILTSILVIIIAHFINYPYDVRGPLYSTFY